MGNVQLPRASPGSVGAGGGRGAVRLPDIRSIPSVAPARDPGVTIAQAQPSGIEDIGAAIMDVSEGQIRAAKRQRKEFDATKTTEAKLAFQRAASEEFLRRRAEDDPSRPEFMADLGKSLGGEIDSATGLRGGGGVDQARGRLWSAPGRVGRAWLRRGCGSRGRKRPWPGRAGASPSWNARSLQTCRPPNPRSD